MGKVKNGDTVKIHYTGKLNDGSVFDSSEGREPLEFKVGGNMVVPGFENGVIGMKKGDNKTISISPEEAYGERREDQVNVVERTQLPEDMEPEVGMALQATGQDGSVIPVAITEVNEKTVTVDANHPLAGKELIFDLELVEIV
ncbi:MAG: peptidylprolyl isomerase [Proteobacteria bacterium]|nr:peptidylprolyl isomerase [Pseudomonadota bacterium]